MPADPGNWLELGEPEYGRLLADVLELCRRYHAVLPSLPAAGVPDRARLDRIVQLGIPEAPASWNTVKETLGEAVLASQAHLAHPRFFAFVPGPNNAVSGLADWLVSVFNPFAASGIEGSGAQTVEQTLLDWLGREIGLPAGRGGVFLSGGSISNLTALVTARQWRFGADDWRRGTLYFSDQTHASVARAARILGFTRDQIRVIPADDDFRLPVSVLCSRLAADQAADRVPFCVVANAGTTNTGAVDPLPDLHRICRDHQVWLHVDGAYGGAAALCEEGKALLQGLKLADSITLDPHKWLFQPIDCSCLLVRESTHLRRAFHMSAEYLQDAEGDWNFWDYGPELTRPFRALKLWLSLQLFGAAAFRNAITRGFALARYAEHCVRALPDWQIVTPAYMGIVTFRYAPPDARGEALDRINRLLAERCVAKGIAFPGTTHLRGKTALRLCTINPRTTEADIAETIEGLRQVAAEARSSWAG